MRAGRSLFGAFDLAGTQQVAKRAPWTVRRIFEETRCVEPARSLDSRHLSTSALPQFVLKKGVDLVTRCWHLSPLVS